MPQPAMASRHPYRDPGEHCEPPRPEREPVHFADLDAEIVMFLVSSVVLVAGVARWELGIAQALALLGLAFSCRQFLRAIGAKDL